MQAIKQISIPQPCHEQWGDMEQEQQGRFCQSCAKTVIDFSAMTDQQVIDYLTTTHNVCGKFDAMQFNALNHKLYAENLTQASWWKKLAMVSVLLSAIPSFKLQAQSKPAQQQCDTSASNNTIILGKLATAPSQTHGPVITGHVADKLNKPLPGVIIRLQGTRIATSTDIEGNFKLTVPPIDGELRFSAIGYNNLITKLAASDFYNVKMDEAVTMLGGVVIVRAPFYKRWYYRFIKRPVKKIFG